MFALAAGSQINQDKSLTIWVSQEPKLFTWGTEENLRWLGPSETTQYLGFEIELQISLAVCFEKARSKLKQKFAYWATKLSLGSRVLIANQILLASTSFIGSYWSLDRNAILKDGTCIACEWWSREANPSTYFSIRTGITQAPSFLWAGYETCISTPGNGNGENYMPYQNWGSFNIPQGEGIEWRPRNDLNSLTSTYFNCGWD
uniref:Uncharacterized protein n=1 Tax=Physcomitrium patens TaxID=3218 RepID=A0A2K1KIV7_PHYPA|nr:hypothetical protein PHYPA_007383 [Physcomitrium patens]